MDAEEQLPGDLGLVLVDRGYAQHLGFARRQAKASESIRAEARDLLVEQQCMRIAR